MMLSATHSFGISRADYNSRLKRFIMLYFN